MKKSNTMLNDCELTIEEFEKAFKSLKRNKACGFDDINPNMVISSYNELLSPLFHICKLSLATGCFPEKLKIAKITPLLKSGEINLTKNYRPISVLPVFSKLLEKNMYYKVYEHVTNNQLLYEKQFGFQQNCSTDYAILELSEQIYKSFHNREFTLGVFVDLSKAFDMVNHEILLDKLSYFGLSEKYIKWFKSYLHKRQQYISYNNKQSTLNYITCGVPQGSILGPLLFLLYVNDLQYVSNIIKPIMFADDTNLFLSNRDIKQLFLRVNQELTHFQTWFNANKLSLNTGKTKYSFFHSPAYADRIPLRLPKLAINNTVIERENSIKFLGVLLDENLTWSNHISCIHNKISKNIGLLYKARSYLNRKCLKQLYFSFIHSYLNYANITWGSSPRTKQQPLFYRQKHASRLIFYKDKLSPSKPLMKELNSLNIFQLNIYQILLFMHKVKNNSVPRVFNQTFSINNNKYNTRSTKTKFSKPFVKSKTSQYAISFRGPQLWNKIVPQNLHDLSFSNFKVEINKICFTIDEKITF